MLRLLAGASASYCISCSWCLGLDAWVCADSFLVAVCQGLAHWLCHSSVVGLYALESQVSGSMAGSAQVWACVHGCLSCVSLCCPVIDYQTVKIVPHHLPIYPWSLVTSLFVTL